MDSQDSKAVQPGSETAQTFEAQPPSLSTLSLDSNQPKAFSDLPDHIFDRILSLVDVKEARSLALVKRCWYGPARKRTPFFARGFNNLLRFSDLILELPTFAQAIHQVCLYGLTRQEEASQPWPFGFCPNLAARAIATVLDECPQIESVKIGAPPEEPQAQEDLMAALGKLHLRHVTLATPFHHFDISSFSLALPALRHCQLLKVAVDLNDADGLSAMPRCSIKHLTLHVNDATAPSLQSLLDALATDTLDFSLTLRTTFVYQDLTTSSALTPACLNTILQPYVVSLPSFHLHLNLADRPFAR